MLSKSPSESVSLFFKNTSNNVGNNEKLLVFLIMFFTQFQLAISQSPTPMPPSKLPDNSHRDFWIILGATFGAIFLIAGCCAWGMNGFKCCSRNKEYDEVGADQPAIDAYQLPELTLKVDPL